MKMNLKKKRKQIISIERIKQYFTYKNLFIFLLFFVLISIILGGIFYYLLDNLEKSKIINEIESFFTIYDSYDYFNLFKNISIDSFLSYLLIWILGLSVFGLIVVLFIFFLEFFGLGFTICCIIDKYKLKGFVAIISYIFPGKIIYLLGLLLVVFFAIKFSYNIIKYLLFKQEIDLRSNFKSYIKFLLIILVISLIYSIFEVFITPFMIKIFLKII